MGRLWAIIENFFSFKRVPIRVIVLTGLMSYAVQIGTIIMGQPLYVIVIATIIPWIPVLLFESMWKVQHYHWVAVIGVLGILQSAHLVDFAAQAVVVGFANGTTVCPAPLDNEDAYGLAVDEGLRPPHQLPTGIEATRIAVANNAGTPRLNANDVPIYGPPACGFFGQLNLPILALSWDIILLVALLLVLQRFPSNGWLWFAMVVAAFNVIEHGFVTYAYYFLNSEMIFAGTEQLWATIIEGTTITAVPVGIEPILASFYQVTGQHGLVGHDGMLGVLIPSINDLLPTNLWREFLFNTLIAFPVLLALVAESRRLYDFYLAEALPTLSRDQLVSATTHLQREVFNQGDVIIKQGELADDFYIISSGEVEVIFEDPDTGKEEYLATLIAGQYFGEVGLVNRSPRVATVRAASDRVEVMKLDYQTFTGLLDNSEMSRQNVQRVMEQRVLEVKIADET